MATRDADAEAVTSRHGYGTSDRSSGLRLIGPEIEIRERDGSRGLMAPTDDGYSALWTGLSESERTWDPSWRFHPDDDPDSSPPGVTF